MRIPIPASRSVGTALSLPVWQIDFRYNVKIFLNDYLAIDDIDFKSGRVGLAKVDSTTFVNVGTTQALAKLNFVYTNGSYLENKTRTTFENNNLSKCVLNILFDLYEIERRKMMTELRSKDFTFRQADIVYQNTKLKMAELQKQYLREVNKGQNIVSLQKLNDFVKTELGIDNMEIFLTEEEK